MMLRHYIIISVFYFFNKRITDINVLIRKRVKLIGMGLIDLCVNYMLYLAGDLSTLKNNWSVLYIVF